MNHQALNRSGFTNPPAAEEDSRCLESVRTSRIQPRSDVVTVEVDQTWPGFMIPYYRTLHISSVEETHLLNQPDDTRLSLTTVLTGDGYLEVELLPGQEVHPNSQIQIQQVEDEFGGRHWWVHDPRYLN